MLSFLKCGGILGKLPADPATSATSFTTNQAREQKHLAGMVTRVCHPDICNEDEGEACHEYKASLDHRVRSCFVNLEYYKQYVFVTRYEYYVLYLPGDLEKDPINQTHYEYTLTTL